MSTTIITATSKTHLVRVRSLPPLPCLTRVMMRLSSIPETLSETTSLALRLAP